uniref:Uncharacterized protein n=1 Tax=Lotharella globosa TaxID=91324 RepID=A0A7S4DG09_9EUKA|mmetsp:Transcript_7929/g.15505  ORF Transcript_7929/g.15505 Transcript_7929/m.15505 type:complete len:204 (+) Transcript_7929:38-649(+)
MPRRLLQAERRHLTAKPEHETWNYLKDKTKQHSQAWDGMNATHKHTRFHKGFHRKNIETIKQEVAMKMPEIQAHQELKASRRPAIAEMRRQNLRRNLQRNGNIITGSGMPKEKYLGRKHVNDAPSEYMVKESRVRMMTGGGRFHIPLSPRGKEKNLRRQQPRLRQTIKGRSSIIGYGRSELQSLGTLDNFGEVPMVRAKKVIE